MTSRIAGAAATTAAALGLLAAAVACSGGDDESSAGPAGETVADLPAVTDFSIDAEGGACAYDPARGGLVQEGLTIASESTGALEITFHVQRDSLDDILPGYVTTVLVFDDDSRSHTFDLVVPVTRSDYEAGYDECHWTVGDE